MDVRPFAGLNARPSPWGYNWNAETPNHCPKPVVTPPKAPPVPEPSIAEQQYAQMPAVLLSALKRDKKPFTYTPGGVNLPEVLEARLQKRMERKKRYCEEKPPKQVIVMPTYNTPLDMYSMENAVQALELQAGLVANDSTLGCRSATLPRNHRFCENDLDSNRGVAQSKAFKVLQIITDTDQDADIKGPGHPDIEMRFRGLRDSSAIPSKFFQTLQKITGTDQEDEENSTTTPVPQENIRPAVKTVHPPNVVNAVSSSNQMLRSSNFETPNQLRRPAAFLPAKGNQPQFKPVRPPFLVNKVSTGVTDF